MALTDILIGRAKAQAPRRSTLFKGMHSETLRGIYLYHGVELSGLQGRPLKQSDARPGRKESTTELFSICRLLAHRSSMKRVNLR